MKSNWSRCSEASSASVEWTSYKRVLVYRLGSLGDTIVALPVFHLIRRAFPNARISLLTNRPVASKAAPIEAVLGKGIFFDEVIDYPIGLRNPLGLLKLLWNLRTRRFDAVVHLAAARGQKHAIRDYWFFRLAGIRHIIGLSRAEEPAEPVETAEYRRLASRLSELGDAEVDEDTSWDLHLSTAELEAGDALLARMEGRPFLTVSCGTKWRTNDWEENNWQKLVERLGSELPGWGLVLLGAAEERERCDRLASIWPDGALNLCGETTPRVSAAIMRRAGIFIGHDSGPLHLAACMGIPCIGIYSARNLPGRWFPRGERTRILYHRTDCAGCGLEFCEYHQKKCILSITVDEVFSVVQELLKMPNHSPKN
jgi:ADP-heptose:LPS heptosyltransferase